MTFADKVKKEIKGNTTHPLAMIFYKHGNISDPKNKHYELSITPEDERVFEIELIENNINMAKTGKTYYIKNFDGIIGFLNIIGAENACFEYLDSKVLKEIRANSNREVNFEMSNIKRQAEATKKQLDIIAKLDVTQLSARYQRIVKARLRYKQATMAELAKILNMSKSGLTYAFRRMSELHT